MVTLGKRFVLLCFSIIIPFTTQSALATYHHRDVQLYLSNFSNLPGWISDDHIAALHAFKQSCRILLKHHASTHINNNVSIHDQDFKKSCHRAKSLKHITEHRARVFFEAYFIPIAIEYHHHVRGFFTGYYTPFIHASLKKQGHYQIPIYARPDNLPTMRHHKHYLSRRQINAGEMAHHAKILLWTNSLVTRFFLQVQGAGVALLENGKRLHLNYSANNGWPFTGIGKWLVAHHRITRPLTTQSIKSWLHRHPKLTRLILNHDASFIFYQISKDYKTHGSHNVILTAKRSLAVDQHFIPFGTPLWLSTWVPNPYHHKQLNRFQHLLIAQDSGSAIRGPIRGDVYWGYGKTAGKFAGAEHNRGRYWLLLPTTWVKKHLAYLHQDKDTKYNFHAPKLYHAQIFRPKPRHLKRRQHFAKKKKLHHVTREKRLKLLPTIITPIRGWWCSNKPCLTLFYIFHHFRHHGCNIKPIIFNRGRNIMLCANH